MLLGKNQENGIKEDGEKCVIYADEADTDSDNPYLMSLMGRRIPFIIMGIDEEGNRLLCSRKKAQDQLKAAMLQGLASGKVYEGELVSFSRYGGYIEVSGVTGHIRNSDFSDDHSDIREYMKVGDKVEVRCKEVSKEGYIFWEALNKVHRTNPLEYDFEEDTIVMGTVVRIADFKRSSGVFVNLQLGIDALCPGSWRLRRAPASLSRSSPSLRTRMPPRLLKSAGGLFGSSDTSAYGSFPCGGRLLFYKNAVIPLPLGMGI